MGAAANERRLAAILAADVVGYSRMMGADEAETLARLRAMRHDVVEPLVAENNGRVFKTTGDGLLAEFPSTVQAVRCAIAVQERMRGGDVQLRIGVHQGDVVVEGDDLLGDGINVAARLEGLAEPGGICISGRVREDAAGKLALEVEDLGEPELKNIAQRHRVFRVRLNAPEQPVLALPNKPSIVVLPFQNMSGDPEQEYFADGMVEEIITALGRISWLFVIARNSTFTYKGQAIDVKRVGRELGVRYVLEGSVRKGSGRVRIRAQLIEAETGVHLWADRFDGSLEDVFTFQDQVASNVAGAIEPTLHSSEIRRATRRPTSDLTAYDLCLRAQPLFWSLRKEGLRQALGLLEEAIARDPQYGPAFAWAAICRWHLWEFWGDDEASNRRISMEYARRALVLDENDAATLANAAYALGAQGEDIDTMLGIADRALALQPSFARGWYISGNMKVWAGDYDTAIERLETSLRLSPRARVGTQRFVLGLAYLCKRQFDRAAQHLNMAIQEHPGAPHIARNLAACYAHMGRLAEAREMFERVREMGAPIIHEQSRGSEHENLIEAGLRLAMDPQG
jgi:TolB-like protein/Tfp pilus assembly protein PilF